MLIGANWGHRITESARTLGLNERTVALADGSTRVNTLPNADLYPFQWNWDSAIVAMGFAAVGDVKRGLAELQSLHSAQHRTGLLPHIAFSNDAESLSKYFPGPKWWGELHGIDGRRISGITQPAVSGIALKRLVDAGLDADTPEVRALLTRIHDHHEWWMRSRDPLGTGDVVVTNGWSTGLDNLPPTERLYADQQLHRLPEDRIRELRRDIKPGADPASRPTNDYYAVAAGTTEVARSNGGYVRRDFVDHAQIQLSDPNVTALLGASVRDVGAIASRLGGDDMARIARRSDAFVERLSTAQAQRAARSVDGTVYALDAKTDRLLDQDLTISSAMAAWMPGTGDRELLRIADLVADGGPLAAAVGGVRSTARDSEYYHPKQYWRGPTWPHMNEMVSVGLLRAADEPGRDPGVAARVRAAVAQLDRRAEAQYDRSGAPEYLDPETGERAGKDHMSFSNAALLMFAQRHGAPMTDAFDAYRSVAKWDPAAMTSRLATEQVDALA